MSSVVTPDAWQHLRGFTRARLALGRSGVSLPTAELLRFGLAHAQARDAVHLPLDAEVLQGTLEADGWRCLQVASAAPDRDSYLRRPDWGRRLDAASPAALAGFARHDAPAIVFMAGDGLSSLAVARHVHPLLAALRQVMPELADGAGAPVVIARQARVALGDEIGYRLGAAQVVVLIGERPGLSSPDSLGIYLTQQPRPGLTDADRNCISNVRPEGLSYLLAAHKLAYLIAGARRLGRSGVDLKDDSSAPAELGFPSESLS